jgi:hypothetical protein
MRIAFILIGNSRRSGYLDGETLRYGGAGGSGTDTSTILVAEQLAAAGHEVVVTSEKLEPALEAKYAEAGQHFNSGRVVNGVQYCDIEFNGVENKAFDVLVSSLWFQNYSKLPITVSKAVLYWCHMQWIYGIGELVQYAKEHNLALGFVHISEWEKSMNADVVEAARSRYPAHTVIIPNPEPDDVIEKVKAENIVRKPHKFIFHAAWPRGGDVALEVVRRLPYADKEFHAFDYLMVIHDHGDEFFNMHNGVDKVTLYRHLAEAEYFVYPLYTPYQDVHKDTFSCVVADAIALGCTPVTYPLGALPENFEGYCQWVNFPTGANQATLQAESLSKDLDGKFKSEEAVNNLVSAVEYLDNNPALKDKIKAEGTQFVLDKCGMAKVGQLWGDFLAQLTAEKPA